MSSSLDDAVLATVSAYEAGAHVFSERTRDRSFAAQLYARFVELSPGTRVLDLGCGPAHDAAEFANRGFVAVGCDSTVGLLREARSHLAVGGRLVLGDSRQAPFVAESFDGVWACASLLHIAKAQISAALTEVFRILRPSGVFFASTQEGSSEGFVSVMLEEPFPDRYYAYYRFEEWLALVEKAGFELIEQRLHRTRDHVNAGATGWIETFARKP